MTKIRDLPYDVLIRRPDLDDCWERLWFPTENLKEAERLASEKLADRPNWQGGSAEHTLLEIKRAGLPPPTPRARSSELDAAIKDLADLMKQSPVARETAKALGKALRLMAEEKGERSKP